jgi:hypothetical protein
MLRILGSRKQLCDGVSRREMLRVGGLGLAGLALPQMLALTEASAASNAAAGPGFGRAKNLLLIHLYGAPSQIEWVDPKPDAPAEVRGDLGVIPSNVVGCQVGELFPKMAQVMDKVCVLRSLTHEYPIHGVAHALTGVPAIDVAMELKPNDARHWPFFGSVVEFVDGQHRGSAKPPAIPPNIALPFRFSSQREGEVPRAGPFGAFLGNQYDPVWTEFRGTATKGHTKTLNGKIYNGNDPYMGVADDCHFALPNAAALQPEWTIDRLNGRRSLLEQMNGLAPQIGASASASKLSRHQEAALALLESPKIGAALDVRQEDAATRALYGPMLFGQSCLAARRLLEAGGRVVSVFWDEFGLAGMGWDTHWNHYPRMKDELAPGFDQGWYGLLTDLDRRGLLDETLVVCTSEHGRTPKLTPGNGGGRDHWSRVYSSIIAGAGIARGKIVGASDKHAGEVADRPISPKDLLATMYHLLGIDPHTLVHDRAGRPVPLTYGQVIGDVLA